MWLGRKRGRSYRAVVCTVAANQKLGIGVQGDVLHGHALGGVVAEVEHFVVDAVDDGNWDLLQTFILNLVLLLLLLICYRVELIGPIILLLMILWRHNY